MDIRENSKSVAVAFVQIILTCAEVWQVWEIWICLVLA